MKRKRMNKGLHKQNNNKIMKIINKSNHPILRMKNKTKIPNKKDKNCDFKSYN